MGFSPLIYFSTFFNFWDIYSKFHIYFAHFFYFYFFSVFLKIERQQIVYSCSGVIPLLLHVSFKSWFVFFCFPCCCTFNHGFRSPFPNAQYCCVFFFSSIERLYIPGNFWKIWVYVIRAYKGFPFYKIWRFTTAATLFYFWEQNAFVGWMQWSSLPRETWVHRKISFVQIFRWALFSLLGRTNCLHLSPEQGTNLSNNIYQKIVFSETDWECISRKSVQKKIKVHC